MDPIVANLAQTRLRGLGRIRLAYVVTFAIVVAGLATSVLIRFESKAGVAAQAELIQCARGALLVNEQVKDALAMALIHPSQRNRINAAAASGALDIEQVRITQIADRIDDAPGSPGSRQRRLAGGTAVAMEGLAGIARGLTEQPWQELAAGTRLALLNAVELAASQSRQSITDLLDNALQAREQTMRFALQAGTTIDLAIAVLLLGVTVFLFEPLLKTLARRERALDQTLVTSLRLAAIAQRTDNVVVVADTTGRIEWVNPAFTRISGYTLEEVQGRSPGSVLQRGLADPATVQRIRAALREGRAFSESIRNFSKSGEPYWTQIDCQPLYDSNGLHNGFMAVQSDITESRQRQSSLERLNLRFAMATEAAGVGAWELNWDTKQMWWSETLYKILGVPPQEVASSWYKCISLIHPDDRDALQSEVESAACRGEPLSTQVRVVAPDGTVRTLEARAAVTRDEMTHSPILIGTVNDISERIERAETERRLQLQIQDASRIAGMAEVATGVLHNVGNIVNSLGIAVSTAQSHVRRLKIAQVEDLIDRLLARRDDLGRYLAEDKTGREIAEYVPLLTRSLRADAAGVAAEIDGLHGFVEHLRRIVRAQQSYGRLSTMAEKLDVRELLDTACALLAPMTEAGGSRMNIVRRYQAAPVVETNRTKLLDICCNLIKNAHEAMAAAPVSRELTLAVEPVGGGVQISVSDNGSGIHAQNIERLWEFGFSTKGSGHGFGLHSVAIGVRELGGHVDAHSDGPGAGATFRLWIPFQMGQQNHESAAA